jgi:hypothetical protein
MAFYSSLCRIKFCREYSNEKTGERQACWQPAFGRTGKVIMPYAKYAEAVLSLLRK